MLFINVPFLSTGLMLYIIFLLFVFNSRIAGPYILCLVKLAVAAVTLQQLKMVVCLSTSSHFTVGAIRPTASHRGRCPTMSTRGRQSCAQLLSPLSVHEDNWLIFVLTMTLSSIPCLFTLTSCVAISAQLPQHDFAEAFASCLSPFIISVTIATDRRNKS